MGGKGGKEKKTMVKIREIFPWPFEPPTPDGDDEDE